MPDRDRVMIAGSRTFGKGPVPGPVRLAGGSGIIPDVVVEQDRPPREAEPRALTVSRGLPAAQPNKDRG